MLPDSKLPIELGNYLNSTANELPATSRAEPNWIHLISVALRVMSVLTYSHLLANGITFSEAIRDRFSGEKARIVSSQLKSSIEMMRVYFFFVRGDQRQRIGSCLHPTFPEPGLCSFFPSSSFEVEL